MFFIFECQKYQVYDDVPNVKHFKNVVESSNKMDALFTETNLFIVFLFFVWDWILQSGFWIWKQQAWQNALVHDLFLTSKINFKNVSTKTAVYKVL